MRSTLDKVAVLAMLAIAAGAVRAQDVPGDQETARRAIHVCAACHGDNGISTKKAIPSLAGQMPQYFITQLKDFRSQTRAENGTQAYMWGISALLDDATISGLADYYAKQPAAAGKSINAALVKQGKAIYAKGMAAKGVRACAQCHGDAAEGAAGFPRLAGQRADYVEAQLKLFRTRLRPHGVIMKDEVKAMTPAEDKAVAAYVFSL
jgi:cytochrome c553